MKKKTNITKQDAARQDESHHIDARQGKSTEEKEGKSKREGKDSQKQGKESGPHLLPLLGVP